MPQFFSPMLTWNVAVDPAHVGEFTMTYAASTPYTAKSQYMLHATLLGANDADLTGNDGDNCLAPNAGQNTLDGRGGTDDRAVMQGSCLDYAVSTDAAGNAVVVDVAQGSSRDGTTTLKRVEHVEFADGAVAISVLKSGKTCTAGQAERSPLKCSTLTESLEWEHKPRTATATPPTPTPANCKNGKCLPYRGKRRIW